MIKVNTYEMIKINCFDTNMVKWNLFSLTHLVDLIVHYVSRTMQYCTFIFLLIAKICLVVSINAPIRRCLSLTEMWLSIINILSIYYWRLNRVSLTYKGYENLVPLIGRLSL